MPGLVINGKEVEVPGVRILNWNDDPRLRRGREDGRKRRTRWVRQIWCHTTKGIPGGRNQTEQTIRPGKGPDQGKDLAVAKFWSMSASQSGAHIIIDTDGSAACIADVFLEEMFNVGVPGCNTNGVGIENYQLADGSIYEATLDTCVKICDALCKSLWIQRQVHAPYLGHPVRRLQRGGGDCVGVFGHRDATHRRGRGDPGDALLNKLIDAGYEDFDFEAGEDIAVWRERQEVLGLTPDGVPGLTTCAVLRDAGYRDGQWTRGVPVGYAAAPSPTCVGACAVHCP